MEEYNPDTLTAEDGNLFHQLWDRFLFYVADQYGWEKVTGGKEITPQQFFGNCAKIYYDDRSYMDRYLQTEAVSFPEEHKRFLEGWKEAIYGEFIVLHLQKRGAVFVSMKDRKVYLVKGIVSPWEEIFDGWKMPIAVQCALLDFGGIVISDGLFVFSVQLRDRRAIDLCEDMYRDAVKNKTLIKRFNKQ